MSGDVGYYDEETGLLTVLVPDEVTITTHLRPDQPDYVWTLPRSTYR